jgi:hypothetical protein
MVIMRFYGGGMPVIPQDGVSSKIRLRYRVQSLDDGRAYVTILSRQLAPLFLDGT